MYRQSSPSDYKYSISAYDTDSTDARQVKFQPENFILSNLEFSSPTSVTMESQIISGTQASTADREENSSIIDSHIHLLGERQQLYG